MKRVVLGLTFAAALGVGALFAARTFTAGRGGPREPTGPSVAEAASGRDPERLRAPDTLPAPGPAPGARLAPVETRAAGRSTVAAPGAASADDLLVRVVLPDGHPVGELPIEVGPAGAEPQADASTDASGHALFERLRAEWLGGVAEPWVLRHRVLFEEPPELVLTRAVLAESPVLSVQPWTGAVEVSVRTLDGEPARDGTDVELALVREGEAIDPRLAMERPSWSSGTRGGHALFPFAELGREWEARARRPGSDVWSRALGAGPVARGEVAAIEVVLGGDHPILAFRAVDEAGTPFRDAPLRLEHTRFFGFTESTETETDGEGWFTIDLPCGTIFGAGSLVVSHVVEEGVVASGRVDLGGTDAPGLHRRGDVVLSAATLLASGRVVDGGGRSVPEARVVAGSASFGGSLLDGLRWGWVGKTFETRTDRRGEFELFGLLGREEVHLQAGKGELSSEILRVREGEQDAVLVVVPRHPVTGELLCDPGVDPGRIGLQLVEAGADGEERELELDVTSLSEAGEFVIDRVPVGLYALECRLDEERLARLEPVQVVGPTDVGTIDLRGAVHAFEIALLGAGSTVPEGEVAWRVSGSEEEWRSEDFEGTRIQIVAADPPLDVWVRPAGFRHALLERVVGRREVALEAPLRVRLELATDGELPAFPYFFDPDLMRDGVHVGVPEGSEFFTDANRTVVFLVSVPGELTVAWHLERKIDNGAIGGHVLGEHAVELEVLDVAGEQTFVLELDGEALTRLARAPPF